MCLCTIYMTRCCCCCSCFRFGVSQEYFTCILHDTECAFTPVIIVIIAPCIDESPEAQNGRLQPNVTPANVTPANATATRHNRQHLLQYNGNNTHTDQPGSTSERATRGLLKLVARIPQTLTCCEPLFLSSTQCPAQPAQTGPKRGIPNKQEHERQPVVYARMATADFGKCGS